jgi:hypothetical protein
MTRTISIHIIAFFLWLKISSKNFPEIVSIPIAILALCLTPLMLELTGINALFNYFHNDPSQPNRSLQAFEIMLIAMIYVFLANAAAYAAIKYNRRDLWEFYTYKVKVIVDDMDAVMKELRFYWACYFFGILAAIFLAHSLIIH